MRNVAIGMFTGVTGSIASVELRCNDPGGDEFPHRNTTVESHGSGFIFVNNITVHNNPVLVAGMYHNAFVLTVYMNICACLSTKE